jgi:hypothetical protein
LVMKTKEARGKSKQEAREINDEFRIIPVALLAL